MNKHEKQSVFHLNGRTLLRPEPVRFEERGVARIMKSLEMNGSVDESCCTLAPYLVLSLYDMYIEVKGGHLTPQWKEQ